MERPPKRPHPDDDAQARDEQSPGLASLSRPISPPRKRQRVNLTSPWQLTWIRDLPESQNRDAVTLKDLLGDPLIAECWQFNYLHDIPFIMDAFDPDTRHLVDVHIVHGFWKNDDPRRMELIVRSGLAPLVIAQITDLCQIAGTSC